MEINNCMDTIDSRDIIKRIKELESDIFILDIDTILRKEI